MFDLLRFLLTIGGNKMTNPIYGKWKTRYNHISKSKQSLIKH